MRKLANFTLHDQTEYVEAWRSFGYEIDPKPRAPLVNFESGKWTEERILKEVALALKEIKKEGFDAIMIGGLSNAMAYAWFVAWHLGLEVVMARTPRLRTPDGHFIFELTGYSALLTPGQLSHWIVKTWHLHWYSKAAPEIEAPLDEEDI